MYAPGTVLNVRLWPKADVQNQNLGGVARKKSVGFDEVEKAKPTERWGRKATGPRVLRRVKDDPAEGPKTAGLPKFQWHIGSSCSSP